MKSSLFRDAARVKPETYWSRVNRQTDDECWPWIGSKNSRGYGILNIGTPGFRNKSCSLLATHIALYFDGRAIPSSDYQANHICDNPACVNPKHLYVGTQLQNIADRNKRGRTNRPMGARNHRAKLTVDDVVAMRNDYKNGRTITALMLEYNIERAQVMKILRGLSWTNADGPTFSAAYEQLGVKHIPFIGARRNGFTCKLCGGLMSAPAQHAARHRKEAL